MSSYIVPIYTPTYMYIYMYLGLLINCISLCRLIFRCYLVELMAVVSAGCSCVVSPLSCLRTHIPIKDSIIQYFCFVAAFCCCSCMRAHNLGHILTICCALDFSSVQFGLICTMTNGSTMPSTFASNTCKFRHTYIHIHICRLICTHVCAYVP